MTATQQAHQDDRAPVVVGVAVEVPEPWGAELRRLRASFGDTQALTVPTHITLLPPTPTPAAVVEPLRQHLVQVGLRHSAFTVRLRGTGTFRPVSRVVYVQLAEGVSSCERLQAAVRRGPVERHLAYPYHPHVTLAQDVPDTELQRAFDSLADYRADFVADHFCLYVQRGEEPWQVAAHVPLVG